MVAGICWLLYLGGRGNDVAVMPRSRRATMSISALCDDPAITEVNPERYGFNKQQTLLLQVFGPHHLDETPKANIGSVYETF